MSVTIESGTILTALTPEQRAEWVDGKRVVHVRSTHLRTEPCPACHRLDRVIAWSPEGGRVILAATAVHAHECRYWRTGKSRGPCTCGANDLWAEHFADLVTVVTP